MRPKHCTRKGCNKRIPSGRMRYCCEDCGVIARQEEIPIELRRSNRWTAQRIDLLYTYWGQYTAGGVAKRINAETGSMFTYNAVRHHASRLGILARLNQGERTIADVAREVGQNYTTVLAYINRHDIETTGTGLFSAIAPEAIEPIKRHFKAPIEPVTPLKVAAQRLGYSSAYLAVLCSKGRIRGYLYIGRWYVAETEISRIIFERIKTA